MKTRINRRTCEDERNLRDRRYHQVSSTLDCTNRCAIDERVVIGCHAHKSNEAQQSGEGRTLVHGSMNSECPSSWLCVSSFAFLLLLLSPSIFFLCFSFSILKVHAIGSRLNEPMAIMTAYRAMSKQRENIIAQSTVSRESTI